MLNNIPLFGVPHLLVCSPVGGHLHCFHVLATVNNAAVNKGVKFLFETLLSVLLGICPEVELLGHMIVLLHKLHL